MSLVNHLTKFGGTVAPPRRRFQRQYPARLSRYSAVSLLLGLILTFSCCAWDGPGAAAGIGYKTFARGFTKPVHIVFVPGSARAAYVVEQEGKLFRLLNGRKTLILDISRVVNDGWEEGLLSVAFPPDYREERGGQAAQKPGSFYINYTADDTRGVSHTYIVELPYRPGERVRLSKSRLVLKIRQPYSNHNGGHILFGPDKMMYIGTGDGGSGGDPRGYGQNRGTLLGKILRIDPKQTGKRSYRIPGDNPFLGKRGYRPEIYATGLRNPWRISFDRQTGKLYAADVGQNRQEEVALIKPGSNQGWNIMEGRLCYKPKSGCNRRGLTPPIWVYGRREGGSITGGYVYRGKALPELKGHYIFGDYMTGNIWALPLDSRGKSRGKPRRLFSKINVSSFGEDTEGEIYIVYHPKGTILKLSSKNLN